MPLRKLPINALLLLFASSCFGLPGRALPAVASADVTFVQTAEKDALGQYQLGLLGEKKAHDAQVKAFARRVASNASAVYLNLKHVAAVHHITLANAPGARASYQYSNLSSYSGRGFDTAFLSRMNIDATIASYSYNDYVKVAQSDHLRAFAHDQIPVLKSIAAAASRLRHKLD